MNDRPEGPGPSRLRFPRRLRWDLRALVLLFPLLNRFLGLEALAELMRPRGRWNLPETKDPRPLFSLIDRRLRNARWMRGKNCLWRTFLAYRYLCAFGLEPEIHFGLKGDKTDLGHCWIELGGEVMCETDDVRKDFPVVIAQVRDRVYRI